MRSSRTMRKGGLSGKTCNSLASSFRSRSNKWFRVYERAMCLIAGGLRGTRCLLGFIPLGGGDDELFAGREGVPTAEKFQANDSVKFAVGESARGHDYVGAIVGFVHDDIFDCFGFNK